MKTITRIDEKSIAKLLGIMYAFFGLLFGVFILISFLFAGNFLGGILMLLGAGVGYGILGLIGGYVTAWMYNFIAKHYGGIRFEIE